MGTGFTRGLRHRPVHGSPSWALLGELGEPGQLEFSGPWVPTEYQLQTFPSVGPHAASAVNHCRLS